MKQISIVLGLLIALAAVVFFMRDRSSRADLVAAEKQITTLSNEVDTIKTRMMMQASTNSEHTVQISNHLARIASLSDRVAKAADDLKHAQEAHAATTANLQKQTKKASDGEIRIAELDTEIRGLRKTVEGRDAEITRLRETVKQTEAERDELHGRVQKAEAEIVRLQLDQTDEVALRAQLKRLDQQWQPVGYAKSPRQSFAAGDKGAKDLTAKVDSKATGYYLQMQPDGTVKLLPSFDPIGAPK